MRTPRQKSSTSNSAALNRGAPSGAPGSTTGAFALGNRGGGLTPRRLGPNGFEVGNREGQRPANVRRNRLGIEAGVQVFQPALEPGLVRRAVEHGSAIGVAVAAMRHQARLVEEGGPAARMRPVGDAEDAQAAAVGAAVHAGARDEFGVVRTFVPGAGPAGPGPQAGRKAGPGIAGGVYGCVVEMRCGHGKSLRPLPPALYDECRRRGDDPELAVGNPARPGAGSVVGGSPNDRPPGRSSSQAVRLERGKAGSGPRTQLRCRRRRACGGTRRRSAVFGWPRFERPVEAKSARPR